MSDYMKKVSVDFYDETSSFPQRTITGSLEWVYEMLGRVVVDERKRVEDAAFASARVVSESFGVDPFAGEVMRGERG